MKFTNLVGQRELFELLYGVPSIWSLDKREIELYSPRLKKLFDFFSALHQSIFLEPLSNFDWLSEDRLLQQTIFGDKVKVIANFSPTERQGIPPRAIAAYWLKEGRTAIYSP